jgi:hypothetical protein
VLTASGGLQDTTVVGHTHSGAPVSFKHPAVQSACMFAGEFLCLLLYVAMQWRKSKPAQPDQLHGVLLQPDTERHSLKCLLSFALPTVCDAAATTLLNLGLFFTYVVVVRA